MLIYLGLGSLLALFQRKLIYYPDRVASVAAVSLPGAEIEPVSLTAPDGMRLAIAFEDRSARLYLMGPKKS